MTEKEVDFSIISVYNDPETLSKFLIKGLNHQSYKQFEKILINNQNQNYTSAAEALNEGAKRANGDYYVFIHQDVKLPENYLAEAKKHLENIPDLGVAGAAGVRETGNCCAKGVNIIQHGEDRRDWERGSEISKPTQVDSIDEMMLIIPSDIFRKHPFSTEICQGWHLYGVEYSLRMMEVGLTVQVLPIKLWHLSAGGWRDWKHDLTLLRLVKSYPHMQCIHTTGGSWPAKKWFVIGRLITNLIPIHLLVEFVRSWQKQGLFVTLEKSRTRIIDLFSE